MRALSWSCGVWEFSSISSYLERIPSMTPRYKPLLNRMIFYDCWLWPDLSRTQYVQSCILHTMMCPPSAGNWSRLKRLNFSTPVIVTWVLCLGTFGEEPWSTGLSLAPQRTWVDIATGKARLWSLNAIWVSQSGWCKPVSTVWCNPLLWVGAATTHPLQVRVSLNGLFLKMHIFSQE